MGRNAGWNAIELLKKLGGVFCNAMKEKVIKKKEML